MLVFNVPFIFFWTNGHEIVPISLIEKKSTNRRAGNKNYTCGIIEAKFFAPAAAQNAASALTFSNNLFGGISFWLKTSLLPDLPTD